jgi:hypothetical protein
MFMIFNETDQVFAHPEPVTEADAAEVIQALRSRYEQQGFYRTSKGERISPAEVEYSLQPAEDEPVTSPFDQRETATILAALRYWQRRAVAPLHGSAPLHGVWPRIEESIEAAVTPEWGIATDNMEFEPLAVEEIDALCEKINAPDGGVQRIYGAAREEIALALEQAESELERLEGLSGEGCLPSVILALRAAIKTARANQ